jgi:XTP/dITP diphosphohydrolase
MRKLVIASGNLHKIKEIKELVNNKFEVVAYSDLVDKFEIIEDGKTFEENASIKAQAVYDKIKIVDKDAIVLADDSGISVPLLNNEPGIYSARYAKVGATDEENLNLLIANLKKNNLSKTPAFYTASIVAISKEGKKSVTQYMHGDVITEKKGNNGFGYDPIFIPKGYDKTVGELDPKIKQQISHRAKALKEIVLKLV